MVASHARFRNGLPRTSAHRLSTPIRTAPHGPACNLTHAPPRFFLRRAVSAFAPLLQELFRYSLHRIIRRCTGIIPVFERAPGDKTGARLAHPGHGMSRGYLFQCGRKRPMALQQLDDGLNQAHAPQGEGLLNRCRDVFHVARRFSRRRRPLQKQGFVGFIPRAVPPEPSPRRSQAAAVAQERNLVVLG